MPRIIAVQADAALIMFTLSAVTPHGQASPFDECESASKPFDESECTSSTQIAVDCARC